MQERSASQLTHEATLNAIWLNLQVVRVPEQFLALKGGARYKSISSVTGPGGYNCACAHRRQTVTEKYHTHHYVADFRAHLHGASCAAPADH
jgi:hypothetical protein